MKQKEEVEDLSNKLNEAIQRPKSSEMTKMAESIIRRKRQLKSNGWSWNNGELRLTNNFNGKKITNRAD